MFESDRRLLNILYRIAHPIYHYSGIEYIYRKAVPSKKPKQHPLPTLPLWLIGIYIAFFGLASQRYENRIDIIERKVTSIYTRLTPINSALMESPTVTVKTEMEEIYDRQRWPEYEEIDDNITSVTITKDAYNELKRGNELMWNKKAILSKIPAIQHYPCPVAPSVFKVHNTISSLFVNAVHKESVEELKELLVDSKQDLKRVNLENVNLEGADLWRANLVEANLVKASFIKAKLEGANLEGARLAEANFRGADLRGANLMSANLVGANLGGCNLGAANLSEAHLLGASLMEASLEKTNLRKTNLREANLMRACFVKANLEEANLEEASLINAFFSESNLKGAYLWEANLEGASIEGSNFEGANLGNVYGLTIEQLSNTRTLYKAKLDPGLMEQVKEKYPHLLEKPKEEESKPNE